MALFDAIRPRDRVTILIPNGMGRNGQEWKEATGRAVMRGPAGWVLNMGGRHGTPGIASPQNLVAVNGCGEVPPPEDMRVEFLRAWEDRTWDTEIVSVPASVGRDAESLTQWAHDNLADVARRKVVVFAVYNSHAEED